MKISDQSAHFSSSVDASGVSPENRTGVSTHGSVQALCEAITRHDASTITKILAQQNVDLTETDAHGQTPLHIAAFAGNSSAINELIQYHRDHFVENHFDNETSQTMAFIAQLRQSKGLQAHDPVLIDAQDHRGFTPLMLATMRGNTAAVQALLTQQANVNALLVSSWQFTFPPCSEANDSAEAERPLRPASNDAKNRSVLMLAAEHGQEMAARLLIEAGAKIDPLLNQHRCTPLQLAAKNGHAAVVELLLQHGAGVDVANSSSRTPLFLAVEAGHANVCRALIANGANTRHINGDGISVRSAAEVVGNVEIINALPAERIDPRTRSAMR